MSIERVRTYFRGFQMEDRILEFEESSATENWLPQPWAVSLPALPKLCHLW